MIAELVVVCPASLTLRTTDRRPADGDRRVDRQRGELLHRRRYMRLGGREGVDAGAVMFCAATSVSIAVAWAGCVVLSAVMNEKMLVIAGVVRCSSMSTFHIGSKPSATVSLASALAS